METNPDETSAAEPFPWGSVSEGRSIMVTVGLEEGISEAI
jgi:hypothetical protein